MQLYYVHKMESDRALADEVEARHLSKVMRKSVGDLAYITAGDGNLWQAEILQISRSGVMFKPLRLMRTDENMRRIAIVVAPTKSASRIEDLLEKGVELGLTDLYLVKTERTLRKDFKTKRLHKLAISAMKQCLRLHLTQIHEMESFSEFLDHLPGAFTQRYIGKIEGNHPYLIQQEVDEDVMVLIGPEGDFTNDEYETANRAGFKSVALSEQRLRTETAGIISIASVQDKRTLNEK